jgi:hypothetical protein
MPSQLRVVMTGDEAKLFQALQSVITQSEKADDSFKSNERTSTAAGQAAAMAAKEQAKAAREGARLADTLARKNETLEDRYHRQRTAIIAAGKAGVKSQGDVKKAIEQLDQATRDEAAAAVTAQQKKSAAAVKAGGVVDAEHGKLKKRQESLFGPSSIAKLKNYFGGFVSGAALVGVARKALQQFNEEQERATGTSTSLVESRTGLRQVSKGDFDQLESWADTLATDTTLGLTREEARQLIFAGRSTGFEGEEQTVAAADVVIPVEAGAAFAGEFRKFFSKENLSIESAFNTALAGAAESQFNISELLPQVRTAAQGTLAGGQSSDVVAATAVLADNFGKSVGDRMRALGVKLSTDDRTKGAFAGPDGGLIKAVRMLDQNPELRKDLVGDSSELKAAVTKFIERGQDIIAVDRRVEREQGLRGDRGLLGKAVNEALDTGTRSGQVEVARRKSIAEEQRQRVAEENRFAAGAFGAKGKKAELAARRVEDGDTLLQRSGSTTGASVTSAFTSDQGWIEWGSQIGRNLFGDLGIADLGAANERLRQAQEQQATVANRLREMQTRATETQTSAIVTAINDNKAIGN